MARKTTLAIKKMQHICHNPSLSHNPTYLANHQCKTLRHDRLKDKRVVLKTPLADALNWIKEIQR